MEKKILDACCGSRMFWFDKTNPNVLFMDKRKEILTAKDRDKIRVIEVNPDIVGDFTNMPFKDESFLYGGFRSSSFEQVGRNKLAVQEIWEIA
jgi:ubiquinone/menaquinone biosynthesis C-methylase UbiE